MHPWIPDPPPLHRRPLVVALAALALTLALGRFGSPAPGFARVAAWLDSPQLAALAAVAGAGLIAHHLARLSILPRADSAAGALPAALVAAATMPGIGVAALAIPAILALAAARAAPRERVVALLVQCGAISWAATASINHIGEYFATAAVLVVCVFSMTYQLSGAANDNPHMKRKYRDSRLPISPCYAREDSQTGSGEYGSVQQ